MSKEKQNQTATEVVDIEQLRQDEHNFNKGTEDGAALMERSLKELGAGRSILIDKNGNIIAGNKTQEAAIKAGIKKVRIIETTGDELVAVKRTDIDIDSAKGRELAFVDNLATQINLTWDETELQTVQADVEGFEVSDFGFDIEDLPQVTFPGEEGKPQVPAEHKEVQEDDFDPDAKYETKVKAGEIWQLGNHRLMCGDSTKAEDIAKLMNGELADLWLTDPPYNVGYGMQDSAQMARQNHRTDGLVVMNDRQEDSAFLQFLKDAYAAAFANMKAGASFYIWHSGLETYNFIQALKDNNQQLRSVLIWNKNQLVMGRQDYQWKHEPCLYGWKDGAAHHWYSDRKQTTVIDWERPKRSEEHPTMKPIGLFGYQMQNSSMEGDIILDSFGGSGTTIVAAEQLGRKARLMELDPHYCNVIIARWEKLTGQKAVKLNPLNTQEQ